MSNIAQFKNTVHTLDAGSPKTDDWLSSAFITCVRSGSIAINVDCFEGKIFVKDLIKHGFGEGHTEALAKNLDKVLLDVARTARVVSETYKVPIVGLTHGFTGSGADELLVFVPIFDPNLEIPASYGYFCGALGDGPLKPSEKEMIFEFSRAMASDKVPRIVTKNEAVLQQEAIDRLETHFVSIAEGAGKYYRIAHSVTDKTRSQRVNSHVLYDGYGFANYVGVCYDEELVDLFNR